jgi:hypothetical protein
LELIKSTNKFDKISNEEIDQKLNQWLNRKQIEASNLLADYSSTELYLIFLKEIILIFTSNLESIRTSRDLSALRESEYKLTNISDCLLESNAHIRNTGPNQFLEELLISFEKEFLEIGINLRAIPQLTIILDFNNPSY